VLGGTQQPPSPGQLSHHRLEARVQPTAHASSSPGEIGGRVWASYTRAYYGRVLSRPRSLATPLSASGTLWIQAGAARWAGREERGKGLGQGAPTFGFFNGDSREWRTNNSLGLRVEEDGGPGLFAVGTEYGTGNFRAAGDWLLAPAGRRHLVAGRRYRWRLAYNPSAASRRGAIALSVDGVGSSTQLLDPGDRSFGTHFNRFGLINHMIEGNDATLYFGDLKINGVRQNLGAGPAGWEGRGNDASFADCMIDNRHDFGFTGAGNGGGPGVVGPAPAHAVAGVFWQTEAGLGSAYSAYYADRIPTLTLDDEIYARGTVILARASSDSAINFGFFNAATVDVGQNVPHNFVGLNTDGPSRAGHYFRPALRSRSGPLLRPRSGPTIIANGARHRWTFHYVPGPRGGGRLTATFDGRGRVRAGPDLDAGPGSDAESVRDAQHHVRRPRRGHLPRRPPVHGPAGSRAGSPLRESGLRPPHRSRHHERVGTPARPRPGRRPRPLRWPRMPDGAAIQTIGSYAGLLAIPVLVALAVGLRALTRDIRGLNRWAGDAPERARELEVRDRRRTAQSRGAGGLAGESRPRATTRAERRG
jgi:hypothetical protein